MKSEDFPKLQFLEKAQVTVYFNCRNAYHDFRPMILHFK